MRARAAGRATTPRRALAWAGWVLLEVVEGAAIAVALAGAYTLKRRLGIDVFPGRDMLPDGTIEAVIGAVWRWMAG